MKVSKKSLIVSIAVLCVCALSLSAASFAWFTASNNASVNTLTMNVTKKSSLEIKVGENGTWKSVLTVDDFVAAGVFYKGTKAGEYTELRDVSTSDMASWIKATYVPATNSYTYASGTAIMANDSSAVADYVKLPIYFRASTAGKVKVSGANLAAKDSELNGALRLGTVNGTTKKIYGNAETGTYQDGVAADNVKSFGTDMYSAFGNFAGTEIALTAGADGYYEAQVDYYIWIEGTDPTCVDKNTPATIEASIDYTLIVNE